MHAPRAACWDMRVEAVCGSSAKQLSHGAARCLAFRRSSSVAETCVHTKFETAACALGIDGRTALLPRQGVARIRCLALELQDSTNEELSTHCAESYCPAQRLECSSGCFRQTIQLANVVIGWRRKLIAGSGYTCCHPVTIRFHVEKAPRVCHMKIASIAEI